MSQAAGVISGQEILDKLETDHDSETAGRMDALRVAVKAFLDAGDEQSARQAELERVAFAFRPTKDTTRGRWYGPILQWTDEKGQEAGWPTKNHLDASVLQHLRTRAQASANPHIKARFCDLLWEFENSPNPAMARTAVAAYLTMVRRHLQQNTQNRALDVARHLERARIIASQLRDQRLRAEVMAAHREAFDEILRGMHLPIVPCADLLRSMMRQREELSDQEVNERLAALDTWADQHPDEANSLLRAQILKLRIEWAQQQRNQADAHRHRLEIARLREREGDDAVGRSAMVAQTFYLKSHQMYADLGATADRERVKKKLLDVGPKTLSEMNQFSTEVTIPREDVEQIANVLREYQARDALRLMAGYRWWIPKAAEARQWLERAKKDYPLQFLFPKVIEDQDGNAYELAQGDERDRHEVLGYIATGLMISARFSMREAFKVLVEELKVSTDDFLAVVGDAPWLDQGRLPILRESFDDYLAERHVSAAHILIPQFEGMLRDFADFAGLTPVGIRGRRMVPQTMDVLLTDQRFRDGLGEDFVMTLEAFLIDEVGQRVRHIVTHGNVTNAGVFSSGLSETLIYLVLQLSGYRLRRTESAG